MKTSKSIFALTLFVLVFYNTQFFAQEQYEKNFYGGLFYISNHIASDEFESLKKEKSDLAQVDLLFEKAIVFFDGDISEALLCLTFATLPYNHIELRFLFGTRINIPLPSVPKKIFERKLKNLPEEIFFDSPKDEFGDKDKLAHFFGNAFLSSNFGWFNLSKFMGMFVEQVEEGLFVNGGYSNKDLITNHLGDLFGECIKNNRNLKPSDVLKIYQLLFLRI